MADNGKISRTDRKTNKGVVDLADGERTLPGLELNRKKSWIWTSFERRKFVERCYGGKNGWEERKRKSTEKDVG